MPPQLAFYFCIIFTIFLFIIDNKSKLYLSSAIWVPLIWMMIISSRLLSQWLNQLNILSMGGSYLQGNPIDRTVFSILIALGLISLLKRKLEWSRILKSNALIMMLLWYCGISILWSDYPFISFKRWIKEFGNIIMVLVVLTEKNPNEAVKTIIRRCAYVLIPLSIVLIKYYPYLGRNFDPWGGAENVGVATSKNMLATLCLICGLFFVWSIYTMWRNKSWFTERKKFFINILLLSMISWLLIKANSANALGALIIGIFLILFLSNIKRNIKFLKLYVLFAFSFSILFQISFDIIGISVSTLGRDMTFTGRTDLWKDVLHISTNPLIGTGYESFWLGERLRILWENHWWLPNQAHNGYIETYINLGWIGLVILAGVIIFTFRKIYISLFYQFNFGKFRMVVLVITLIYNIMESGFQSRNVIWFIFLLNAIEVPSVALFSNKQIIVNCISNEK